MNKLNPSIKHHLILGGLLSIWVFAFAFIIRPFDDGTLNLKVWFLMSLGFSLGVFLSYAILAFVQNKIFQKTLKWNSALEISSLVFFILLYLGTTFFYYKSPILHGGYTFVDFLTNVFIKALLVTLPIIILARKYVLKLIPKKENYITIRGENKLDVLKIKSSDLVCVTNAQNYVEIFYLEDKSLETKLIRSSLKKIITDIDFLIQVHRSHLINPAHFKSWKDTKTLSLTQIEIPVSKKYKDNFSIL